MRIVFIAIISFISSISYCQNFIGKLQINNIFGDKDQEEYLLSEPNERTPYGNYIFLNENGTFESNQKAPCLNQRFYSTSGVYELIDTNRVRFILKRQIVGGIGFVNEDEEADQDFVIFSIEKGNDSIKLTKIK